TTSTHDETSKRSVGSWTCFTLITSSWLVPVISRVPWLLRDTDIICRPSSGSKNEFFFFIALFLPVGNKQLAHFGATWSAGPGASGIEVDAPDCEVWARKRLP